MLGGNTEKIVCLKLKINLVVYRAHHKAEDRWLGTSECVICFVFTIGLQLFMYRK